MFDAIVGFFRRPVITAKAGSRSPKVAVLERIEWIVAIVLSATVLFLLIVRTSHVGALWRDECDSVQLAQLPRLRDLIANLHFTSFPVFFSIIVRCYTAVFGASDFALRCFSLIIGALFICAAW